MTLWKQFKVPESKIILNSLYPTQKNLFKILAIRGKVLKNNCKTNLTPKNLCILDTGIPMILLLGLSRKLKRTWSIWAG